MPVNKQKIFKKISDTISRIKEVELAYVYGSFLTRSNFNDIDVAVLLNDNVENKFKLANKIGRILEEKFAYRFKFDVRPLNMSPVYFQHEVIKFGKPVYVKKQETREEYEFQVLTQYLEYSEMYKWFDEMFLAKSRQQGIDEGK
ncbi:MAG: nucleotidyltransferase domain-containing protein [Candidatus Odinarchaeia archaeon]